MTSTHATTVESFADRLRSLDDEAFASFVADLRRNAGWGASTDGATVTATRQEPTAETRRIRALADDRSLLTRYRDRPADLPSLGDVDELVAAYDLPEGEAPDVRVTGPAELYRELFYAVDRETCRAICERYFGQVLEPLGPSERGRDPRRRQLERVVGRVRENRRSFAALAATVLLLFAAVTVGALGSGGGPVVQPGGGTVPDGNEPDVTPVGGGDSGGPTSATPTGSTPSPQVTVDQARIVRSNDSYFFSSPEAAVLTFGGTVATFENNESSATQRARQFFVPDRRPNASTMRSAIENGSYGPMVALESQRVGRPAEFPVLRDTEAVHQGYLVVGAGSSRIAYQYTAICERPPEVPEDYCWRLRNVTLVGPVNGSTPASPGTESTQTG